MSARRDKSRERPAARSAVPGWDTPGRLLSSHSVVSNHPGNRGGSIRAHPSPMITTTLFNLSLAGIINKTYAFSKCQLELLRSMTQGDELIQERQEGVFQAAN